MSRRLRDSVVAADRLVRLHMLFFTGLWVVLGAASVRRDFTATELWLLLTVVICFHVYTFVLNDVIDLPIDRTQALRQHDALVRGAIQPWQALTIVFIQPLLAIPLTMWLGGTLWAYSTLASGFLLMGAYNLWGKRCPAPPLTDLIQGLGWGSLAVYGAQVAGGEPSTATWLVALYAAAYTLFMNGIHGGLRDLDNDFSRGARTTAIFLGARPAPAGGDPFVPRTVSVFAASVLAGLAAINATLLGRNDFGYGPAAWTLSALGVGGLILVAVMLHGKAMHPHGRMWEIAWRLQMYLVLISLPVAFLAHLSGELLVILLVLTAISLPLFDWTFEIAPWAWLAITGALRPRYSKRLSKPIVRLD